MWHSPSCVLGFRLLGWRHAATSGRLLPHFAACSSGLLQPDRVWGSSQTQSGSLLEPTQQRSGAQTPTAPVGFGFPQWRSKLLAKIWTISGAKSRPGQRVSGSHASTFSCVQVPRSASSEHRHTHTHTTNLRNTEKIGTKTNTHQNHSNGKNETMRHAWYKHQK